MQENALYRADLPAFREGVRRAVMRCRTVQQHTVDGVTIRYPPARGARFTTPPPGGTSCFTTHRRRSGRRARPNFGRALPGSRPKFGQRYRCDNLSQPLPAGSVGHGGPPHQAGPVAIHGHCLRLYPVRPAYRLTLDVDGGEIWAGVDQRREVSVFDNLFIRLVLPFPLDQHFFNLFSLFLRKMFNLIRLQFSRCIALLVFGHFCQIRND